MGVLQVEKKIEKFWLPSTASLPDDDPNKEWVLMDTGELRAGDIIGLTQDTDEIEASLIMLSNRITDWSYVDEAGVPIPVVLENVKAMKMEDYAYLAEKIQGDVQSITPDQKKS